MERVKWRRGRVTQMEGAASVKAKRWDPLAVGCGSTMKQSRKQRLLNKARSVASLRLNDRVST